jgi:hypothetical protein
VYIEDMPGDILTGVPAKSTAHGRIDQVAAVSDGVNH